MVTRDRAWPAGTPCWVDLGVADIAGAARFYARLFGWDIAAGPPQAGGYSLCRKDGRAVAGIGSRQDLPGRAPIWTVYIAAGSVAEAVGKITAAGGQILVAPMTVMDRGQLAVATDPAGAVFGVWQAGRHIGMELANEPGSVCWTENFSRDFDRSQAFYQAVFGYGCGDLPAGDFRYATLKLGSHEVGGIGELGTGHPAGLPAGWSVYFAVDDTDEAVATITASGGSVIRAPWDSPYGRMAVATDDQGGVFSLMSTPVAATG